jgi:hypothetical protein
MSAALVASMSGLQRASAEVAGPLVTSTEAAAANPERAVTKVQFRRFGPGYGWRGGWRPGYRWRPGYGWVPLLAFPLAVAGAAAYYYGPGPYYYGPRPYYYGPGY